MRSFAWWISPIMRTWSSINALTLAPADAGLLNVLRTPLEEAGTAIAAGLSGIRQHWRKLHRVADRGLNVAIGGRSMDRGRIVRSPSERYPAGSQRHRQGFNPRHISQAHFQVSNRHKAASLVQIVYADLDKRLIALMRQEAEKGICKFLCVSSRAFNVPK